MSQVSVIVALLPVFPMCGFQSSLLLMIIFGLFCYFEEVASEMVLVCGWVVRPGDVDVLTFVWVEFHTHLSSHKVSLSSWSICFYHHGLRFYGRGTRVWCWTGHTQ